MRPHVESRGFRLQAEGPLRFCFAVALSILTLLASSVRGDAFTLHFAGAQQSEAVSQSDAGPWPPPGVYMPGQEGVTLPRRLVEIKPQYTANAMRAKIQGVVTLACIVEIDGTVGRVRVLQSLDRVHGLDDQAVAAAKRSRFVPGMKDNASVPVLIYLELAFTLRGVPPVLAWPDEFSKTDDAVGYSTTWKDEVTEASGLQIRVAYPAGWEFHEGGSNRLLLVHTHDGMRSIGIAAPRPTTGTFAQPLDPAKLQQFADYMMRTETVRVKNLETLGVGQVQSQGHLWIWYGAQVPTIDVPSLSPEQNQARQASFSGSRLWMFTTIAGKQTLFVSCTLLIPRAASEADKKAQLRQAGAEFGAILRRMSIQVQ